ncbi:MAG: PCRF domain-containing protein, partial [Candidatus Marinimicrobia bacterium]|nr:PCRF domain-containing protein [Candidatus Neomarinimicrobiota bacterium]
MAPDFWNNNQKASLILKQIARLEKEINLWTDMERRHGDVEILFEFAEEGEASLDEIKTDLSSYQKIVDDIELKMILGKKEDAQNAIITI